MFQQSRIDFWDPQLYHWSLKTCFLQYILCKQWLTVAGFTICLILTTKQSWICELQLDQTDRVVYQTEVNE